MLLILLAVRADQPSSTGISPKLTFSNESTSVNLVALPWLLLSASYKGKLVLRDVFAGFQWLVF